MSATIRWQNIVIFLYDRMSKEAQERLIGRFVVLHPDRLVKLTALRAQLSQARGRLGRAVDDLIGPLDPSTWRRPFDPLETRSRLREAPPSPSARAGGSPEQAASEKKSPLQQNGLMRES